MFKKILLILITSFLSFPVFAAEDITNNSSSKNSIILGFGSSIARIKISANNQEYERYKDVEPKANINLIYLRRLDILNHKLSMGLDIQTHISDKLNTTQTDNSGNINRTLTIKGNYTIPLTTMYLLDYNLITVSKFDISAQIGLGAALQKVKTSVSYTETDNTGQLITNQYLSDQDSVISPAFKLGLVSDYNIIEHLAVGLGVHYINIRKASFSLRTSDIKVKNDGILTTNINLIYKF